MYNQSVYLNSDSEDSESVANTVLKAVFPESLKKKAKNKTRTTKAIYDTLLSNQEEIKSLLNRLLEMKNVANQPAKIFKSENQQFKNEINELKKSNDDLKNRNKRLNNILNKTKIDSVRKVHSALAQKKIAEKEVRLMGKYL